MRLCSQGDPMEVIPTPPSMAWSLATARAVTSITKETTKNPLHLRTTRTGKIIRRLGVLVTSKLGVRRGLGPKSTLGQNWWVVLMATTVTFTWPMRLMASWYGEGRISRAGPWWDSLSPSTSADLHPVLLPLPICPSGPQKDTLY